MSVSNDTGLDTSVHHPGAPAPTDPAPASFLPIMFPSEGTETPVKDDLHLRPVLFVDSAAPVACLLGAAKLRLGLIKKLGVIASRWNNSLEEDITQGIGLLLEPLVEEVTVLVAAVEQGGAS